MASNFYTSVEQYVRARIYDEKLEIHPDVILNDTTLRAQAEEMMHDANEDRRIMFTEAGSRSTKRYDSEYQSEMGKLGGKKGFAQMYKNLLDELGTEEAVLEYFRKRQKDVYKILDDEWKKDFHKKGGQIGGKITGPITGKLAVESGQLAAARETSIKRSLEKAAKQHQKFCDSLPFTDWFTLKEAQNIDNEFSYKQTRRYLDKSDLFETKKVNNKRYWKIVK